MAFVKATRKRAKLKLAITGPAGSGKSYSALRLATGLGGRIAFIDTENGSASLYSDRFDFDVLDVAPPFTNEKFVAAIKAAVEAGYGVVILDSATHAWQGVLDFKAKLDARGGNSYTNWNEAGKKFQDIMDAILQSPVHFISCMRSKQDYVLETNDRGKQAPKKVGLAPIMRDGSEFEHTTVFDVDMSHHAKTSKDRTGLFNDQIFQITEETGKALAAWMESGAEPAVANPPTIGGSSPGIAQPSKPEWSTEQREEAGAIRQRIHELGGEVRFKKIWDLHKNSAPSEVIDRISALLRELEDIAAQAAEGTVQ